MSNFTTNSSEFVSLSKMSRDMSSYIESLNDRVREKYIIMKNSAPKAVLMDMECYEKLLSTVRELEDLLEEREIAELIQKRRADKKNKKPNIALDQLGKQYGLKG